jgi:YaiO family outer membrane protein
LGLVAASARAQSVRVSAWSSYESVTASQDWSSVGAQLTATTARGHSGWFAAEYFGRFGETDVAERLGGSLHPTQRLWLTAETGTSRRPIFTPMNTWDADASGLVAARTSVGIGYRRWNYAVGPVDVLMPHLTTETSRMSWSMRVFLSRNPSKRTDTAVSLRVARALTRRTTASLLGAAGRESYLVGGVVRSLETVTGGAGIRYNAASGTTLRLDVTVIHSRPVLSRSGMSLGVERAL